MTREVVHFNIIKHVFRTFAIKNSKKFTEDCETGTSRMLAARQILSHKNNQKMACSAFSFYIQPS